MNKSWWKVVVVSTHNLSWGKGLGKGYVLVWLWHTNTQDVDLVVPQEAFLTIDSRNQLRLQDYKFIAKIFIVFGSPTPPYIIMRRALVIPPNIRYRNSWKQKCQWETKFRAFNTCLELLLEHYNKKLIFNGRKILSKIWLQICVHLVTCPLIT